MRILLTLVKKDFANFFRNRSALTITFVVPIVLIYIFGWVFGINRKDNGPSGILLAVVNESDNPAAEKLVTALKGEKSFRVVTTTKTPEGAEKPLTEADARQQIHDREYRFALVLPKDLVSDSRLGLHLKILSDPRNEIESQLVTGLLQKAIFTNVPQLLGQSLEARAKKFLGDGRFKTFNRGIANAVGSAFNEDPDGIEQRIESGDFGLRDLGRDDKTASGATGSSGNGSTSSAGSSSNSATNVLSRIVNLESEQVVGKEVKSPEATRLVGGWAIMFLLFALSNSAAAFFDEKNSGIFQRLLSAPVQRSQLLWSRFVFGMLLGLGQLTIMFYAGHAFYGIDIMSHFALLVIMSMAAAAACTAFGMLVAAFTPNAQAASGLATLLVLTMSALGGAWFPISLMPEVVQKFGKLTLVYWSLEGFSEVLWAGNSFTEILPTLGILTGIAVVVMTISVWRINRTKMFE